MAYNSGYGSYIPLTPAAAAKKKTTLFKTPTYSGARKITKPTYGGYGVSNTTDSSKSVAAVKKAGVKPRVTTTTGTTFSGSGAPSGGGFGSGASGSGSAGTGTSAGDAAKAAAEEELTTLEELRKERLAAAIDALTAEFDIQEGTLGAEKDTFQGIFDRAKAEIGQTRERASDATYDSMIERGLGRSGFLKTELTQTDQPYVDLLAQNVAKYNPEEGALGSEYRRIESALKLLAQQEEAQQREIELESEAEQMEYDKQMALLAAGMG